MNAAAGRIGLRRTGNRLSFKLFEYCIKLISQGNKWHWSFSGCWTSAQAQSGTRSCRKARRSAEASSGARNSRAAAARVLRSSTGARWGQARGLAVRTECYAALKQFYLHSSYTSTCNLLNLLKINEFFSLLTWMILTFNSCICDIEHFVYLPTSIRIQWDVFSYHNLPLLLTSYHFLEYPSSVSLCV